MFYSGSTKGFYEEAVHGARKLSIIDPTFVWPQVEIENPHYDPETSVDESRIFVNDPDVVPPMIEIDNPDCKIPADAVEITAEEHAALLDAQSAGLIIQAGADGRPGAVAPPLPTITELIATKLANINDRCESEIAAISAGYPASEVLSWSKQETEARAYQANHAAATPLLDALATARGITKAELANRVILKADMFAQISGSIIGKRQGLEDQIDALPADATAGDLEAIQW